MNSAKPKDELLILIAEDEAPIADLLATVVEELGYCPLLATDGQQALELARSTWPQLVLTDLMMPRLNGADLIAALRSEALAADRPPLPVILMTAAGPYGAQDTGAYAVLGKPFELTDLERLIMRTLAGAGSNGHLTPQQAPTTDGAES